MGIVQNWPDDTVATGWFIPLREEKTGCQPQNLGKHDSCGSLVHLKGGAPMKNFRKMCEPDEPLDFLGYPHLQLWIDFSILYLFGSLLGGTAQKLVNNPGKKFRYMHYPICK